MESQVLSFARRQTTLVHDPYLWFKVYRSRRTYSRPWIVVVNRRLVTRPSADRGVLGLVRPEFVKS